MIRKRALRLTEVYFEKPGGLVQDHPPVRGTIDVYVMPGAIQCFQPVMGSSDTLVTFTNGGELRVEESPASLDAMLDVAVEHDVGFILTTAVDYLKAMKVMA